ncbi:MAG: hypothetical protein ACLSDQ_03855 [Adlercreutzia equolifaciens]
METQHHDPADEPTCLSRRSFFKTAAAATVARRPVPPWPGALHPRAGPYRLRQQCRARSLRSSRRPYRARDASRRLG